MDLALSDRQRAMQRELRAELGRGSAGGGASGVPIALATETLTDLVVVAEELGRAVVPSPFHNGVVQSGFVLRALDDEQHLDSLHRGERRYACCITEPDGSARLDSITTRAVRDGDAWMITGTKCFVPHAATADVLLVVARSDIGLRVLAVDASAPGVTITPLPTLGLDQQCVITFDSVRVTSEEALGHDGDATAGIEQATARSLIVLCADAVGAAAAALDHTLERVKTREQWNVPIGSFQAVQHRCADMLIDVTTARDAVYDAAGTVDRGADALLAASQAQAFVIDACRRVSAAAHQLNGGLGFYADQPVHLWYRRIKAAEPVFGTPDYHRARVAAALLDP